MIKLAEENPTEAWQIVVGTCLALRRKGGRENAYALLQIGLYAATELAEISNQPDVREVVDHTNLWPMAVESVNALHDCEDQIKRVSPGKNSLLKPLGKAPWNGANVRFVRRLHSRIEFESSIFTFHPELGRQPNKPAPAFDKKEISAWKERCMDLLPANLVNLDELPYLSKDQWLRWKKSASQTEKAGDAKGQESALRNYVGDRILQGLKAFLPKARIAEERFRDIPTST